jgi:hypothetical protein
MDGFAFTSAAIVDDQLDKFDAADIHAAMDKMRAVVSEGIDKKIDFCDFSLFGASRSYRERKMELHRKKPLLDTGILVRGRYDVQIADPDFGLRMMVERLVKGLNDEIQTDLDTELECFADGDTVMEG